MRKIYIFSGVFLVPLLLASCGDGELSQLRSIEKSAMAYKSCRVNMVTPGHCDQEENAKDLAILKAKQAGVARERIDASVEIGQRKVKLDPAGSPYERIRRSVTEYPFFMEVDEGYYQSFQRACEKEQFRSRFSIDGDSLLKSLDAEPETVAQLVADTRNWLKSIAFRVKERSVILYLARSSKPCLPENPEFISDEFPYLTYEMARGLHNNENLSRAGHLRFSERVVNIYPEEADARRAYKADTE